MAGSSITFGFPGITDTLWSVRLERHAACSPDSVLQALAAGLAADTGLVRNERLFLNSMPPALDWGIAVTLTSELPENDVRYRRFRARIAGRNADFAALWSHFGKISRRLPLTDWAVVTLSSGSVTFAEIFAPSGIKSSVHPDGGIDKLHLELELELLVVC